MTEWAIKTLQDRIIRVLQVKLLKFSEVVQEWISRV